MWCLRTGDVGGIQSMVELGDVTPLFDFDLTIHSAFELGIGMAANLQVAAALDPVRRAIDFGLENMVHELIVPHIPGSRAGRVAVPARSRPRRRAELG